MLSRNRELLRTLIIWLVLVAAAGILATRAFGLNAGLCTAGACAVSALPFLLLTWTRYRKLATLAGRVDAVLHGEREVSLANMDEGELAVLESEIDKMVARLNLSVDELAHEKQALADALADISHQIKTPLTSISVTTEVVRKNLVAAGGLDGEVERLRRIEQLERRVERLVSVLLKLARLDAGTIELRREEVDVARMVDEAASPLAIAFDIAEVSLECSIEPACSYTGDAAWTTEALGNILKNCMEHTPAGGTVRVDAWEDALACRIRVTDTGPGIAKEDLPHIFERFYRGTHGAAGNAVDPAGVGIGLSLAQGLINAQGGTLSASNVHGTHGESAGAQFDISFFKAVV